MRLNGKVAIITGGAGGIGRGLTRSFVREGARVLFVDIADEKGRELEAELAGQATFLHEDLSAVGAADRIRDATVNAYGRLDVLVNNAQAWVPTLILETDQERLEMPFRTGVWPAFHLMRACHDLLAASPSGSIINFGSGAGLEGMPTQGAYAMAKEAVRGMTRVAAREWGHEGIRVNVVCPLALSDGVRHWKEGYPDQFAEVEERVPLRRVGDIETDIAPVVIFLASEDSRYMTGQTVMADGGSITVR